MSATHVPDTCVTSCFLCAGESGGGCGGRAPPCEPRISRAKGIYAACIEWCPGGLW
jgi:hypothetical protein